MIKALLFCFFLTLHADRLAITLSGFTIRANNLLALSLLALFLFQNNIQLFSFKKRFAQALLVLICSLLLSLFQSIDLSRSTIFLGWFGLTLLAYLLLPYLLIFYEEEREIFRLYFLSFIGVGLYATLQLLLAFVGIHDPMASQMFGSGICRPNACAYEPSYYALYMTPFVMTTNLYYLLGRNRDFIFTKNLNLLFILGLNLLFIVSTSTSTLFAYLIFGVLLILFSFYRPIRTLYPHIRKNVMKFLGGCTLLFISLLALFPRFSKTFFLKFFFTGLAHHSFGERWHGIMLGFRTFREHPFLGVGLGGYPAYWFKKWQEGENVVLGNRDFFSTENVLKIFEPSNVFVEILASLGVVGLTAFIFLLGVYTLQAKRAILSAKNPETRDLCFALFFSMVVTLCVLQFNQGILRTYIWTHFALTYAFFVKVDSK